MTTTLATLASHTDPASYLFDFPSWEPSIDSLVTSDGRDLTRELGQRLIRRSDNGAPIAVVGSDYTVLPHRALARILDDVTAPFGGRTALGPAKVYSGRTFGATVKLPQDVANVLSIGVRDRSKRAAGLTLRSSHDGTYVATLALWAMRLACSNGAVLPASLLSARKKHTSSIVWLPNQIKGYADRLPLEIDAYASQLRRLSARTLDRAQLGEVATAIAAKRQSKGAAEKIIDMVLSANGEYVPEAPAENTYTALQVFEAATAYDRHHRGVRGDGADPGAVRMNRLIDGDTFGAVAWDVLASF
jgi:hypothetical protein